MDELRSALELANEEELQALAELLFRPKLNPLDYLNATDVSGLQRLSHRERLNRIDGRLRYLAADGFTVLQGNSDRISYRQILLQICRYLKMTCPESISTPDLEAEVFLHVLETAWKRLPARDQRALQQQVRQTIMDTPQYRALPLALQENPLGLLAKGSGALAVNAVVRPWLLQQIARQFAVQMARRQVAQQALARGGLGVAGQIQNRVTVAMASRGMALNTARYGAVRSMFAVLGPALWVWFFADLGWRAIATNHGRVIPAVFALAQIRLTRGETPDYELAQC
ncbi:YaaW family protein [Leptolyngbya sp. PCC 6406]|uniref:YaaW family protein n=1 Tax=Leptolyngbya sp. PCC 6406 TaxID=1173264 RepID=UPI0002ACC3B9|nr:YaaW family protein [Leptolyngbya sp. PCC 6406]